jgi:hypothetical protein
MSSPHEDKSGAGTGMEQEGRPSRAWGMLIFGLVGAASATLAVSSATHLPLFTFQLGNRCFWTARRLMHAIIAVYVLGFA